MSTQQRPHRTASSHYGFIIIQMKNLCKDFEKAHILEFFKLMAYKQFLLHYLGERVRMKLEYTAFKPQNNILFLL